MLEAAVPVEVAPPPSTYPAVITEPLASTKRLVTLPSPRAIRPGLEADEPELDEMLELEEEPELEELMLEEELDELRPEEELEEPVPDDCTVRE